MALYTVTLMKFHSATIILKMMLILGLLVKNIECYINEHLFITLLILYKGYILTSLFVGRGIVLFLFVALTHILLSGEKFLKNVC